MSDICTFCRHAKCEHRKFEVNSDWNCNISGCNCKGYEYIPDLRAELTALKANYDKHVDVMLRQVEEIQKLKSDLAAAKAALEENWHPEISLLQEQLSETQAKLGEAVQALQIAYNAFKSIEENATDLEYVKNLAHVNWRYMEIKAFLDERGK